MNNITLVNTVHYEIGKCNSDELFKIIESLRPDVIFEELNEKLFDKFYTENQLPHEPPEVKSIKKYLQHNNINHFPVDIDPIPNLSSQQIEYMFDTFKKYHIYKILLDEGEYLTKQEGFVYLNSDKCSEIFQKLRIKEKELIQFEVNRDLISQIYKLFYEEQDNRENAMLQNIYNYCNTNQFNQAVFLIGVAHRNSIMQKVAKSDSKANWTWTFFNGQALK